MLSINIFLTVLSPYAAILPMIYISYKVLQKNDVMYMNSWNIGLLALFVWAFFVGLVNKEPVSSTVSVIFLLYFFISVYIQNYYNDESKVEELLKSVFLFSIGSALIGIFEKVSVQIYDDIWWGYLFGIPTQNIIKEGYRICSTFGNANVAGTWFAAMILIGLNFYNNSEKTKKILYALVVCLFVVILAMTGSRGAAISSLFGLVVYGVLRGQRKGLPFLAFVFASVFIIMFVIPQISFGIASTPVSDAMTHGIDSSVYSRSTIWKDSLNMFKLKPVTGWGAMGIYFADSSLFHYPTREPHAHNIWITFAATLGIVGLIIYLNMRRYLYEGLRLLISCRCSLAPLLISIQAAAIAHGMVDFTIMTPQGGILFVASSAIISALAMQYSSERNISISMWFDKKSTAKLNL
jgi:O-antigen ligase